jgi:hypothetical protein
MLNFCEMLLPLIVAHNTVLLRKQFSESRFPIVFFLYCNILTALGLHELIGGDNNDALDPGPRVAVARTQGEMKRTTTTTAVMGMRRG